MKLARGLALALVMACMPLVALADNVQITNNDGTFVSNGAQTSLSLNGTTLGQVMNLGTGFDCGFSGAPACAGSIVLQTGTLLTNMGAGTLLPGTGLTSFFAGGGAFDVTEAASGGLMGFTFDGTFAPDDSWSCLTGTTCTSKINSKGKTVWTGTWLFSGTVNGVLTIAGQTFMIQAGDVQLTTTNQSVTYTKGSPLQFVDGQGTTNFPSPVPEPSTLSLFGGGLMVIGVFARKRFGARSTVLQ